MAVELHVEDTGSGPAVVLLHAFPLWSGMWDEVRAALAGTCRVLTPDLRGFGRSPLGEDLPSLEAMADDVVALLDRLGLERVALGGVSMGGYVAMALLRRHAHRLRSLILADTKAGADPPPARENRERIARTVLAERSPRVLVADVLPMLLGETTVRSRPGVVDRVRAMVEAAPPEAVAWAQRAMSARPASLDVLAGAQVPALVLVGEEDTVSPLPDAEAMAAALPDAQLEVIPGAGHLSAVEVPEHFAALVGRFVAPAASPSATSGPSAG